MKVLVLNCGSSSIKFKLMEMPSGDVLESGGLEKLGLKDSFIKFKKGDGAKTTITRPVADHLAGVNLIFEILTSKENGVIGSLKEIDAVGHRVVHGGEQFAQSVVITKEVIDKIEQCRKLAPLHNGANLVGIEAVEKLLPGIRQVAVFDTAFHQTIPDYAYMYALPYELYKEEGIRRYGFHGTSHRYVSAKAIEALGGRTGLKIITCHLGNGGSISAINDGKSVDTTMGLTPLEGLVMGTRCGDLDPAAVTFLQDAKGWSTAQINSVMNKESGLLGLSGGWSDMRDILAQMREGNNQARLAFDVFIYRVKKYIGAYTAALNGLDAVVFTGGMGENEEPVRKALCQDMEFFGIELDQEKNKNLRANGGEGDISKDGSRVRLLVIPTDEEFMIASDTYRLAGNK